jgi:NADH-quinone oxidoreductase subunit E
MITETALPQELADYVNEWKAQKGNLIMILHAVQDHYGYVPKDICFTLSKELKVPLARIYEVLTFYNYFSLSAPGKYKISVCMGTACYLKGATEILNAVKAELKIEEGETTEDKMFRLEHVRCLGCCGLAPVVTVNGKVYGKMTKDEFMKILKEYKEKG